MGDKLVRERKARGAAVAVTSLVIVAVGFGARVQSKPPFRLSGNGVYLEEIEHGDQPLGNNISAGVEDIVLASEALRVTIGASQRDATRRLVRGALLDVTTSRWEDDALRRIRTVASADGEAVALKTVTVRPRMAGDTPVMRVEHVALGGRLWISTEYRVRSGRGDVEIVTRALNRSRRPISRVRLGDEIDWPPVATFLPGFGLVETSSHHRARWFARPGSRLTYAMAFPDGPAHVELRIHRREADQVAWSREHALGARGSFVHRRHLVVTWRGLAEAARVCAELNGEKVGRVVGRLDPAPSRALLTATHSDGRIALQAAPEPDGSFDLPLVPGRYTIALSSAGGWDEALVDVTGDGLPSPVQLIVPKAERFRFQVVDVSGHEIPARLVVRGLGETPDPSFGPDHRAAGAANEIHTATGEGEVQIASGRYRVIASRGPEYSQVRRNIDVMEGSGAVARIVLLEEIDTPGWIAGDFHLHAAPSFDSEVTLKDRIATLLAAGIEIAIPTDHNHVTDYGPTIREMLPRPALATIPGIEVTTDDWGHFNAYPLVPGSVPPPYTNVTPAEIFEHVRERSPDGIIQVNHPWMPGYGYFHRATFDERTATSWREGFSFDFDAIEVINGLELDAPQALEKNLFRWFDLMNAGRWYTAVGSSDSHRVATEWAGYPRTYVRVTEDDPAEVDLAELAKNLREGRAMVSLGPFVEATIEGAEVGELAVARDGKATLDLLVRAPEWVDVRRADIYVNGELSDVLAATGPPHGTRRMERRLGLAIERDSWVVVLVRGDGTLDGILPGAKARPFAFTNPIFVDADGDGRYGASPPPPPNDAGRDQRAERSDAKIETTR